MWPLTRKVQVIIVMIFSCIVTKYYLAKPSQDSWPTYRLLRENNNKKKKLQILYAHPLHSTMGSPLL